MTHAIAYDKIGNLTFDQRPAASTHARAAKLNEGPRSGCPEQRGLSPPAFQKLPRTERRDENCRPVRPGDHLARKSLATLPSAPGSHPNESAASHLGLAVALFDAGDSLSARAEARAAFQIQQSLIAQNPADPEGCHDLEAIMHSWPMPKSKPVIPRAGSHWRAKRWRITASRSDIWKTSPAPIRTMSVINAGSPSPIPRSAAQAQLGQNEAAFSWQEKSARAPRTPGRRRSRSRRSATRRNQDFGRAGRRRKRTGGEQASHRQPCRCARRPTGALA